MPRLAASLQRMRAEDRPFLVHAHEGPKLVYEG
jgi:hypothetical protein